MINKTIIASAAVLTLGLGALATTSAFAQTATTDNSGTTIVQKLATKFNLNQADVQAVFDADREEHHAQMEAAFETQLNQYVTDGKITEVQKQLIIAKRAEMETAREAHRNSGTTMTPEEFKAAREAEMTALKEWATTNGIDLQYLRPMGKGMHGHGGRFGAAPADTATTPTAQ